MALPTLITDIWLPESQENKFLLFQTTKFVLFFFFFFFNGNSGQLRHLLKNINKYVLNIIVK